MNRGDSKQRFSICFARLNCTATAIPAIYSQEKDTLTYVGLNLIINIDDQLKALNKRDENELKNLITYPMVKYRMPYGMGEALKRVGYIKVSRRRNGSSPLYVYKIRKILPCPLLQSCSSNM